MCIYIYTHIVACMYVVHCTALYCLYVSMYVRMYVLLKLDLCACRWTPVQDQTTELMFSASCVGSEIRYLCLGLSGTLRVETCASRLALAGGICESVWLTGKWLQWLLLYSVLKVVDVPHTQLSACIAKEDQCRSMSLVSLLWSSHSALGTLSPTRSGSVPFHDQFAVVHNLPSFGIPHSH